MKKVFSLILTVAMVISLVACGNQSAETSETANTTETSETKTTILTMSTGDTGGSLYPAGSAIAKIVNDNVSGVKMNIETSSGSADNARNTSDGTGELGLCTA